MWLHILIIVHKHFAFQRRQLELIDTWDLATQTGHQSDQSDESSDESPGY